MEDPFYKKLLIFVLNVVALAVQLKMAAYASFFKYDVSTVARTQGFFALLRYAGRDAHDGTTILLVFVGFVIVAVALFIINMVMLTLSEISLKKLFYYPLYYFCVQNLLASILNLGPDTDGEGIGLFMAFWAYSIALLPMLILMVIMLIVAIRNSRKWLFLILSIICSVAIAVVFSIFDGVASPEAIKYTFAAGILVCVIQAMLVSMAEVDSSKRKKHIKNKNQ